MNREHRLLDEDDRAEYLARAAWAARRSDWAPLAYALMSTHVHWAFRAGRDPSSAFIHPLHSGFAHWLNRKYDRLGPVFAERHSTIACSDAHAVRVLAYIHNNPVRASVVDHAIDSTWTSHRAYVGVDPPPKWLRVEAGLALYGLGPRDRVAFDQIVRGEEATPRGSLDGPDLQAVLRHSRVAAGAPVEVASPAATTEGAAVAILAVDGMTLVPPWPGDARAVLRRVADHTGVAVELMCSRVRRRRVVSAKRLALRVWARHLGRSQVEMRRLLGLSSASASHLLLLDEHVEQARRIASELRQEISPGYEATI